MSRASCRLRAPMHPEVFDRPPPRRFSISSLVSYAVMALVVLVGFSIVGIDLSVLAVFFGVLGIGLGFGF